MKKTVMKTACADAVDERRDNTPIASEASTKGSVSDAEREPAAVRPDAEQDAGAEDRDA